MIKSPVYVSMHKFLKYFYLLFELKLFSPCFSVFANQKIRKAVNMTPNKNFLIFEASQLCLSEDRNKSKNIQVDWEY